MGLSEANPAFFDDEYNLHLENVIYRCGMPVTNDLVKTLHDAGRFTLDEIIEYNRKCLM